MATGPINYTGLQTNLDPGAALLSGIKTGLTVEQVQLAQQEAQKQQALQRQQAIDAAALYTNPNSTAADYAAYTLKYPSQAKAAKQAFDLLDSQQQQDRITQGAQIYGALNSGRQDLALDLIDNRIKALENGGSRADLESSKALREAIAADPQQAKTLAGLTLASWMGADKFSAAFPAISKEARETAAAPGEMAKTEAETQNLRSQVDTRAAQLDIQREENRIKAMEAQLKREDNALKREELQGKLADAKEKRDGLKREQQASADSAFSTVDRALDTISQLQRHPGLAGNLGKEGIFPSIPGGDAANARALIEQLQSQGFLAEVDKMRGLGALTEAEGKKLTNAIGALDTRQSESQFRKQLADIQRQFTDARGRIAQKYGVEATSRTEPDQRPLFQSPKFGAVTQAMIDKLAKQKGVDVAVAEQFFREAR